MDPCLVRLVLLHAGNSRKKGFQPFRGVLDANALFRFKGGQCVLRAMLAAIERKAEPP